MNPRTSHRQRVDVIARDRETTAALEDGEQHRQPATVETLGRTPRIAEVGRGDQRLDLDQQRTVAVDGRDHGRAADPGDPIGEEQPARIFDRRETVLVHLEQADFAGGAEPMLGGAKQTKTVVAITVELEHGVDHVFEHAGTGERSVLGDVPDDCLLYTSPSPRDQRGSRMPSSA